MTERNVSASTPNRGPSGLVTIARLSGGVLLIFLSFAMMNLLSHHASEGPEPFAAAEIEAPQELMDEAAPDAAELFDEQIDIRPDQPEDSPGVLPSEDPEEDHI